MSHFKKITGIWRIYDSTRCAIVLGSNNKSKNSIGTICVFGETGKLEVTHSAHQSYKIKYTYKPDIGDLILFFKNGTSKRFEVNFIDGRYDKISISDESGKVDFLEMVYA